MKFLAIIFFFLAIVLSIGAQEVPPNTSPSATAKSGSAVTKLDSKNKTESPEKNHSQGLPVPTCDGCFNSYPVENPQAKTKEEESKEASLDRLYRRYLCATVVGVIGGFIGLGILFWQSWLLRESVKATRDNAAAALAGARAAEANASGVESQNATLKETLAAITRQAEIMDRQTIATEKTLVLTQRPRITVVAFYFTEIKGVGAVYLDTIGTDPDSPCLGQFYIVNTGGTRARLQEIYCDVFIGSGLPMKRPYEGKVGIVQEIALEPGQSITHQFSRSQPLDEETSLKIRQNIIYIYIIGRIGYIDDLGIWRDKAFCRKLDRIKDRFVPVDNPDYESQD